MWTLHVDLPWPQAMGMAKKYCIEDRVTQDHGDFSV